MFYYLSCSLKQFFRQMTAFLNEVSGHADHYEKVDREVTGLVYNTRQLAIIR